MVDSDEEARVKQAKLENKGVHKDREPLGPLPEVNTELEGVLAETEKKLEGQNILEAKKNRASIRSEVQEQEEDDQKGYQDNEPDDGDLEKNTKRKGQGKGQGKGQRKARKGQAQR